MTGPAGPETRAGTGAAPALGEARGVVFDAYGTLFDVASAVSRCHDVLGERGPALTALWRTKQLEYTWLRSLRGDYVDFWHITGQSLDFAMASLGIDDPGLRALLMEMYFVLAAYPDARGALAEIKAADRRCAILSNGSPSMLTAAVHHANIEALLDAVISVDEIRIYKPHPDVYRLAADRLKMAPSQIVFVSANYWDVSGAAHFGFRVVWINRAGSRRDPLPGEPAAEIGTLAALPALLGAGTVGA